MRSRSARPSSTASTTGSAAEGLVYGSGPRSHEDMQINHRHGGRGFYFCDPNGHLLEVMTA